MNATGRSKDIYWIRSTLSLGDCTEPAKQPNGLAILYYDQADTSKTPGDYSQPQKDTTDPCTNDPLTRTVPYHKIDPGEPTVTREIEVNVGLNKTGHVIWTIDNSTFRGDLNNPLLLLAKAGNVSYPYNPEWNVYDFGSNQSIRIVINNLSPTSHPWHLHGHDM